MSWVRDGWGWYVANTPTVNPIVGFFGGAALVWAAVRQARTATNRHYEQTRADLQRRLTESFSKAVEQLASDKIEARLGGIYTLERLAIEAIAQVRSPPWWQRLRRRNRPPADQVSDLYWTVMETLTAFVRERASWMESKPVTPPPGPQSEEVQPSPAPATDIAAVLAVIRRRPEAGRGREEDRGWRFNLRGTDLRGAHLSYAHLKEADLTSAHLEEAHLNNAYLEGTTFSNAHMARAKLNGAHLLAADLLKANLQHAYLVDAHLEGAELGGAQLEEARLNRAHLEGAQLWDARLEGAHLRKVRTSPRSMV